MSVRFNTSSRSIQEEFGTLFTKIVGAKRIEDLPTVHPSTLGVTKANEDTFLLDLINPNCLKEHSAVRGRLPSNRPFIAIKIQMNHPATNRVWATVVEVIFKKHSIDGWGAPKKFGENVFITVPTVLGDDGKKYCSPLLYHSKMEKSQMEKVRDLLSGKEVRSESPADLLLLLKMV